MKSGPTARAHGRDDLGHALDAARAGRRGCRGRRRSASSLAPRKPRAAPRRPWPPASRSRRRSSHLAAEQRGIGRDARLRGAAEQRIAGLAQRLAAQVVQGDIQRAQGVDHARRAARSWPSRRTASPTAPPHRADPGPSSISVRPRPIVCVPGASIQARAIQGLTSHLADAGQPLVGMDLDHDIVLRRAGRAIVDVGDSRTWQSIPVIFTRLPTLDARCRRHQAWCLHRRH